jgi:hypothetical protein
MISLNSERSPKNPRNQANGIPCSVVDSEILPVIFSNPKQIVVVLAFF